MSDDRIDEGAAQPAEEPTEQIRIGAVLGAARDAQGLSVADVSRALKFGTRQIEALERDDFSELKGNTFLRGFVRSYARFLKLDETPLLDALQQQVPTAPVEVHELESMNAAMPQQTAPVAPARLRQWLVMAVLCLGVIGLGWLAVQAGWFGAASPDAGMVASSPVAPVTVSETDRQGPAVVTAPQATVMNPEEAAASGLRQLEFIFSGTSWVEVKDANQTTLLTGRFDENARQVTQGFPPFQIVIGNASAVKLRYENRSIDLQPHVRAEVARLTVDDNSK